MAFYNEAYMLAVVISTGNSKVTITASSVQYV